MGYFRPPETLKNKKNNLTPYILLKKNKINILSLTINPYICDIIFEKTTKMNNQPLKNVFQYSNSQNCAINMQQCINYGIGS